MRKSLALILTVIVSASATAEFNFQSGPKQVPLVELYTSEGCSSCPRADAWMSDLKDEPGLWKDFVPVAFHVDYWDRLGWKDRFASRAFTERQYRHAQAWKSETVYTPAFVLGGAEWQAWRGQKRPPSATRRDTGLLTVQSTGQKTAKITFVPTSLEKTSFIVRFALLGFDLSTSVMRGENKGQTLRHDFVVLGFDGTKLEAADKGLHTANIEFPGLPKNQRTRALAVWVEREGDATPIQAAGGWVVGGAERE